VGPAQPLITRSRHPRSSRERRRACRSERTQSGDVGPILANNRLIGFSSASPIWVSDFFTPESRLKPSLVSVDFTSLILTEANSGH